MSLGNEGFARLVAEDDEMVIYEYKAIHLDCPEASRFEMVEPGFFYIRKSCFQEPEIHARIRRRPKSRRKYMEVKRINVPVHYDEYLENGDIVIEEGTRYWIGSIWSDKYVRNYLLFLIFQKYQEQSKIPDYISMGN